MTEASSESDPNASLASPQRLGIFPLRNTVVYPYMPQQLTATRERSIAVIEEAMEGERVIGIFAQRNPEVAGAGDSAGHLPRLVGRREVVQAPAHHEGGLPHLRQEVVRRVGEPHTVVGDDGRGSHICQNGFGGLDVPVSQCERARHVRSRSATFRLWPMSGLPPTMPRSTCPW